MKLLHIDSSVLGPHSVSRQVSAAIVDRLRQSTPALEVSYRDLTLAPLAHLSGPHLAAGQGATPDAALQPDIAAGQAVLEECLAADCRCPMAAAGLCRFVNNLRETRTSSR